MTSGGGNKMNEYEIGEDRTKESILLQGGINYLDGIKRFMGNKTVYYMLIKEFCADELFGKLTEAMNSKNYTDAFSYAHALKGASGNLSLDKLYASIYDLTEELRHTPNEAKATELFKIANGRYIETIEAIKKYME